MKKRVFWMLMTVLVGMLLLTGCNGKGQETGEKEAGAETREESEAAGETPAEEPEAGPENEEAEANEPEITENTDLYVFIAASLSNAMEEIRASFLEKEPNVNVIINADSSGTLKTQIEEGALCDVFFSAAKDKMEALEESDLVVEGTVKDLLSNSLVLIKPAGLETEVTGFEDVTNAANIALGGEDVPAGAYAREAFESLGILEAVMAMEVNECTNVSAVLAAVSEQSNEIGVVYATDAASAEGAVEIIASAPEGSLSEAPVYPVGQIVNPEAAGSENLAAELFLEYLQSEDALAIFEKYGFSLYE